MTDPAYIDTLCDLFGVNASERERYRAALRALVADAVRQAQLARVNVGAPVRSEPFIIDEAPGVTAETIKSIDPRPTMKSTPRAQAEARLRNVLTTLVCRSFRPAPLRELADAAESLLAAAPPEPQAPPPDRAAWREEAERAANGWAREYRHGNQSPMGFTAHANLCRALDAPLRWPVAGDEGLRELIEWTEMAPLAVDVAIGIRNKCYSILARAPAAQPNQKEK